MMLGGEPSVRITRVPKAILPTLRPLKNHSIMK